ncbi:MAG: hypothetical protein Q8Q52_01720 [Acidimicrobiia bacterium]|nr:hypothetical protein [Acidimicrobiia bacterium]
MPCIVALFALLSPRLAIIVVALFTNRFTFAFDNWWLPTLGFFLLPWTTLAWVVVYQFPFGVSGFGWFLVILAFVADLLTYIGSNRNKTA